MSGTPTPAYGTTRQRRQRLSYGEIERAATALLKSGRRPTIEGLRLALGGGAPDTVATALSRYWRDLGARIDGDPAALHRLPAEIADLVETVWQRALALAIDAAQQREGANRDRLESLRRETELKAHAVSLRERELDALLRTREKTVEELESHLRTAMGFVTQQRETIVALEARIGAAEHDSERDRQRLRRLVTQMTRQPQRLARRKRKTSHARTRVPPARTRKARQPSAQRRARRARR